MEIHNKRNKEDFLYFWNENRSLRNNNPKLFKEELEKKFGKAPYEFLDYSDIPTHLGVSKKPLTLLDPKYKAQHPSPNFFNFKNPEFIDLLGREYKIAKGEIINAIKSNHKINTIFNAPSINKDEIIGTLLLWVKLPKAQNINPPSLNESIDILSIENHVLCIGSIKECHFTGKSKTGYCIMKNFISLGQSSNFFDNSIFNDVLSKKK